MEVEMAFRCSAVAATTATLVPRVGENKKKGMTDDVASVVITFAAARDTQMFPGVDIAEYEVIIRKR